MGCLQCDSVKPIPTCTTALVIGTTTLGNGIPVYVFVKNLTTGKQYRQAAITENVPPGRVTLLMGQPRQDFYSPNFIYEIWITKQTDTINERQDFTVQGSVDSYECVNVRFTNLYDNNDLKIAYSSHILELDV